MITYNMGKDQKDRVKLINKVFDNITNKEIRQKFWDWDMNLEITFLNTIIIIMG
jgi:hypothetical protein